MFDRIDQIKEAEELALKYQKIYAPFIEKLENQSRGFVDNLRLDDFNPQILGDFTDNLPKIENL